MEGMEANIIGCQEPHQPEPTSMFSNGPKPPNRCQIQMAIILHTLNLGSRKISEMSSWPCPNPPSPPLCQRGLGLRLVEVRALVTLATPSRPWWHHHVLRGSKPLWDGLPRFLLMELGPKDSFCSSPGNCLGGSTSSGVGPGLQRPLAHVHIYMYTYIYIWVHIPMYIYTT